MTLSCSHARDCTAGGDVSVTGGKRAFAATEKNGVWTSPTFLAVPLDVKKGGQLDSISCWSPGNCGAAGTYATAAGTESFVDMERNGLWGSAMPIAVALNPDHDASIGGIACPDSKFCSVVGDGTISTGLQGFAASWSGAWHPATAEQAPGGVAALFEAISCNTEGRCSAGGDYAVPGTGGMEDDAFIMNQVGGVWHPSVEIAGTINAGGRADVSAISCTGPQYCAAVGEYSGMNGTGAQGFTDVKATTTWAPAHEVPGSPADTQIDGAGATAVACTSPGNCVAGGVFSPASGQEAYVVKDSGGVWGNAKVVAQSLNAGHNAATESVACYSPGDCVAAGYYEHAVNSGNHEAFVVQESGGVWAAASPLPGLAPTNVSVVNATSCAPTFCALGGQYTTSGRQVAFVSTS